MHFLLKAQVPPRGDIDGPSRGSFLADLVVRDGDLVGVVNFRQASDGWVAEITITERRQDGAIDLVAYVAQAVPSGEPEAFAFVTQQWPHMRMALQGATHGLSLKDAARHLDQGQISSLAALHLFHHELDHSGDRGVLPKTARMWHLLQQFGSFRPAEVIADVLGEKVPTIHARINQSRAQGLIPPAERMKRRTQRQNEE
jgi:hypothetical protein